MREEAIMVLSGCFVPTSRKEWEIATSVEVWSEILTFLSKEINPSILRDDTFERLSKPPIYEEKIRFAARHFTGGLPTSALPVESLYPRSKAGTIGQEYFQESALYMRDLATLLGLEIPAAFAAYPDHLSIELEIALVLHATNPKDACEFAAHRFSWLPRYAAHLESLNANASFYVAVVEALIGIVDAWREKR